MIINCLHQTIDAPYLTGGVFNIIDTQQSISYIGSNRFNYWSNIHIVDLPACAYIGERAFEGCENLTQANIPSCEIIERMAFMVCKSLTTVSLSACISIDFDAFAHCWMLTSIYLMGSSVVPLSDSDVFHSTPIAGYSDYAGQYGTIYVPSTLLSDYQSAPNWSYFSDRFVPL